MISKRRKLVAAIGLAAVAVLGLSACESDADKASYNLSQEAEAFQVQRLIVGINTFDNSVLFSVEGKCSVEREAELVVTCRHGENDYRKHYMGHSDNVTWISTQLEPVDVSVYHTKIILKPENILPDFDLSTGKQ